MHRHPAERTEDSESRRYGEGSCPAEALRDPGSERGGDSAPNLSPHVDHARKDAGTVACNINRDRPEGTLRKIQRPCAASQDDSRQLRAVNLRTKNKKDGGEN